LLVEKIVFRQVKRAAFCAKADGCSVFCQALADMESRPVGRLFFVALLFPNYSRQS
jgi:hypothetical protein